MLKKILSVFAAGITLTSSQFSCFAKTQTIVHESEVPPNVLFLGDSIAEGYGLEGFETDKYSCSSYSNILRDRYAAELNGKCSETMINDAVSGDTSEQLLTHLTSGEFDNSLASSDAVVISIGGNDILEIFLKFLTEDLHLTPENFDLDNISIIGAAQSLADMSKDIDAALENFNTNLTKISEYIKSKTDGTIIIQTLYNPLENMEQLEIIENLAKNKIDKLNQYIYENAGSGDETRYIIADVAPEFAGKAKQLTNIAEFDIHPNAEGHKVIADCVDKAIRTEKYIYTEKIEVKPAQASVIFKGKNLVFVGCAAAVILLIVTAFLIRKKSKTERTKP